MVDVAIVGAAGYSGVKLTRLVAGHPEMDDERTVGAVQQQILAPPVKVGDGLTSELRG